MRASQVPGKPSCLCDFILNLEDGAQFTIPQMQKACKVSWQTCNNFIGRFDSRFKPRRVGRSKCKGKPYIYQLPIGHKSKSPVDIDHPEEYMDSEDYKRLTNKTDPKKIKLEIIGWDELPAARRINALKALFPNGITVEQYGELSGIMDFLNRVSDSLWYKRTESSKKD